MTALLPASPFELLPPDLLRTICEDTHPQPLAAADAATSKSGIGGGVTDATFMPITSKFAAGANPSFTLWKQRFLSLVVVKGRITNNGGLTGTLALRSLNNCFLYDFEAAVTVKTSTPSSLDLEGSAINIKLTPRSSANDSPAMLLTNLFVVLTYMLFKRLKLALECINPNWGIARPLRVEYEKFRESHLSEFLRKYENEFNAEQTAALAEASTKLAYMCKCVKAEILYLCAGMKVPKKKSAAPESHRHELTEPSGFVSRILERCVDTGQYTSPRPGALFMPTTSLTRYLFAALFVLAALLGSIAIAALATSVIAIFRSDITGFYFLASSGILILLLGRMLAGVYARNKA